MEYKTPELTEAQKRDAAIAKAVDHANRMKPGWTVMALGYLMGYCRSHPGESFTCEDVRLRAVHDGLGAPPDSRAWGGVFRIAAKSGLIRQVAMTKSRGRHNGYATLWRGLW